MDTEFKKMMVKPVRMVIFSLCVLLWFQEARSQDMEFDWANQAGGSGEDYGIGITVDDSGNVFVTGLFSGTTTFGSTTLTSAGEGELFIAKFDDSGNFQWTKQASGDSYDFGWAIAIENSSDIFLTGYFKGTATFGSTTLTNNGLEDIFIAKLDASGNFLWAKKAGGTSYDRGTGIALDGSGNVYVSGYFQGSATFGSTTLTSAGQAHGFITMLDSSGNFLWAKQASGSGEDRVTGIALDGSGNVYVSGFFQGSSTFGSTTLTSAGSLDIFIAKLDASGIFIWAKQAGGSDTDVCNGIAIDDNGNVFVTGFFFGTSTFGSTTLTRVGVGYYDIFIAKLDALGNFLWAKQAGGENRDEGCGIAVDGSGNIYVTGFFEGPALFGSTTLNWIGYFDVFIVKLNASGNFIWAQKAGGISDDRGQGIALDGSGNVYVSGYFQGSSTFGSTTLTGTGSNDIFVAKLKPVIPLPMPTNLVALDGYDHAIPLAWRAPSNVLSGNPVLGYNIRRFNPSGSNTDINSNGTRTYFRDATVDNDQTYSYSVRAVYDNGQSEYSNIAQGHTQTNGYVIQSAFTSDPPTIDGVISSGEWSGAGTANITYPGDPGFVEFNVLNDANNLYVAVDDERDPTLHMDDTFGLFFDENRDREWPSSAPSGEGLLQLFWNGESAACTYEGLHGYWPDHIVGDDWATPSGVIQEISSSSGHVQYEGKIPFSTFLQAGPGSTLGMLLYIHDGQSSSLDELWPQEVVLELPSYTSGSAWALGPFSYGDLVLANSTTQIINVTFRVTVPSNTPTSDVVYLTSDFNSWNPAGNTMTKTATNQWEIILPFTAGQALEYKYTRGSWATVEKGSQGEEISNRTFTVPGTDCIINDTVIKWGDLTSVNVTFRVTVPSNTPASDLIYFASNFNSWNPAANTMTKTGTNQWELTLPFTAGQALEYKYTRGSWATVEKDAWGDEISPRTLTVPGTDCIVNDTVFKWGDLTSVQGDQESIPIEFKLHANYPNPFNSKTTIRFSVKEPALVTLKVFDVQGKEVTKLTEAKYPPGEYEVPFDATGMPSGLYFYQIEMGDFKAMRKMVVLE